MAKAGEFEVTPWTGGYPIWTTITYQGVEIARVRHSDLSDLKYAVEQAMAQARAHLPADKQHEV
jgi:hypothetical protein